jgi:colicin import membrane protein
VSSTTLQRDDLIPQSPDGTGKGLALALLVHALLIAAIAVSVNWRSSTPAGVEAELWAAVPQIAAPRPTAPEPAPTPAPPQPKPPEPPPRAEPAPQVVADAQIAIEKAKREEAKRKEEALRREELQKREEAKRDEAKQEAKREEAQRLKEEQERKKKELAEQKRKEAAQAAAEAEQREKQMQRIAGLAGATGEPNSTGTAQRTAGPSASYAGRIKARILPHITFPDSVEGNPLATVEVRAAPDGTIIGRRLLKSSGVKAWDDAVLRAIDKTEVLPRDTDGRVPSSFEIAFRVRE